MKVSGIVAAALGVASLQCSSEANKKIAVPLKNFAVESKEAAVKIAEPVKDAAAEVKEAVAPAVDAVKDLAQDAKQASSPVTDAVKEAATEVKNTGSTITEAVKETAVEVKSTVSTVSEPVKTAAAAATETVKTAVNTTAEATKSAVATATETVKTTTTEVKNAATSAATTTTSTSTSSSTDTRSSSTLSTAPTEMSIAVADSKYTRTGKVTLSLSAKNAAEMVFYTNKSCTGTSVTYSYQTSLTWTLDQSQRNSTVTISVLFKSDKGTNAASCVSTEIVYDDQAPLCRNLTYSTGAASREVSKVLPGIKCNAEDSASGIKATYYGIGETDNVDPTKGRVDEVAAFVSDPSKGSGTLVHGKTYYGKVKVEDNAGNTTIIAGEAMYPLYEQKGYLKVLANPEKVELGKHLALKGDFLAVGVPQDYRNGISTNNGESLDAQGVVNTDNSTGSCYKDDDGRICTTVAGAGAAFIFKRSKDTNTWTPDAFFKPLSMRADTFGEYLSLDGNTLVIGAPRDDSKPQTKFDLKKSTTTLGSPYTYIDSGAAYVYTRNTTSGDWSLQEIVKPINAPNTTSSAMGFGIVSLSGEFLAVGAPGEDGNASGITQAPISNHTLPTDVEYDGLLLSSASAEPAKDSGAVYIFNRLTTGSWLTEAFVKAPTNSAGEKFGSAVALDGDYLAVGSSGSTGSVYIYQRENNSWKHVQTIRFNDTAGPLNGRAAVSQFGRALALWGNYLVVANKPADSSSAGNVMVFSRSGTQFTYQQTITGLRVDDGFGESLSLGNGIIGIGASKDSSSLKTVSTRGDTTTNAAGSGAVYVYTLAGSSWELKHVLKAANNFVTAKNISSDTTADGFGTSVAVDGANYRIAVGAPGEDVSPSGITSSATAVPTSYDVSQDSGAAYIFE